jgi:UDP-glucose 4-epimerase
MNILVTGAAGYVGGEIVKHLCDKKWVDTVVGTDINEHRFKHSKYKFEIRDIREPMDDIFTSNDIDTVVHAAYVLPPIHNKNLMEDINKGGTNNVLKASAKAGVKQVLYTSSTTAYGFYPDNDRPLTEESPLRGNGDMTYAKNKKEIEAIMAQFIKEHPDIIVSILRPCFVVGPGFKNPLAEHLKKKLVLLPSNGRQFQYVHEDDVTDVSLMLLEKRIGGIFNVTGDGTMSFSEMTKILGNIRIPLPWPIIYPLNNLAWFLRLGFITKFPSPAMRLMVNPWIASSEKLKRETGYVFKYDTKSAFEDFARSVKN